MRRLKLLSKDHLSQNRGNLFAKIMTDVLNYYGYRIEHILRTSETGMEIDAEGKHIDTGLPFYAECKGHETSVSVSEIQAFYGKYMVKWHDNKQCHGLMIAVAGLDTAAGEFYRRHMASNPKITTHLYEEDEILRAVIDTPGVANPSVIHASITPKLGKPGDCLLLYTPQGLFWIQHVVPPDKRIPSCIALFDAQGHPISDRSTLDYLMELYPELDDYDNITVSSAVALQTGLFQDAEEIVELTGSSEFFEYQLPASPEQFVGREPYLKKLDSFVNKVVGNQTPSRSILIDAPAGLGKSSLVLAFVERLKNMGHFALAVDMHHLYSPISITNTISYAIRQLGDFGDRILPADYPKSLAGFEDTLQVILEIGRTMESHGKLIFIFFDQFETVFRQPKILKHFKELFLRISDARTNVVLGFAFKSNVAGLTDAFDHELLQSIADLSNHIIVGLFSKVEVSALLEKLEKELGETLNKGLRFHLAEFSQGNPWLMKKLCARAIDLRQAGVPQADIAGRLLSADVRLPRDNHLLLANADDVLKAARILQKSRGSLDPSKFRSQAALSAKSFFYVVRDMSLLKLAKVDHAKIILEIELPDDRQDFELAWRNHVQSKLQGNRLSRRILKLLEEKGSLTIDELSQVIESECPYLSAPKQAWLKFARRFAKWLHAADLALLDNKKRILTRYNPATQIRERRLVLPQRHGTKTPQIQYSPIEDIAIRLCQALQEDGRVDWAGLKKSTIFRALATLEDFGFIQRKTQLIKVLPKCFEFVSNPERRPSLFAESALKLESYAAFIEILNSCKNTGNTLSGLGLELREKLGVSWKESTAEKIAKILLDWARHTKLAPGVFAHVRRGPLKGWKKKKDGQIPLF